MIPDSSLSKTGLHLRDRTLIQLCTKMQKPPKDSFEFLSRLYPDAPGLSTVYEWHRRFTEKEPLTEDLPKTHAVTSWELMLKVEGFVRLHRHAS